VFLINDESNREASFGELEAAHTKSYAEVFDETSFMDEAEIDVLLSKKEKEAKARLLTA